MYLLGGNATANASLSLARNYVIWSARLRYPRYTWEAERAGVKSYYIIMGETLTHKSIYDHLTRMATVGEIINADASKANN